MGWLSFLRDNDKTFFGYFEEHAVLDVQAATELVALLAPGANVAAQALKIKQLDGAADVITHRCVEALHKTSAITLNPNEIHRAISRMDDVMNYIEAAAERVALYELADITPDAQAMAAVVLRATETLELAVRGLRDLHNAEVLTRACLEITALENEADDLLCVATARLFRERDPIVVIKWKEIYELLETATARCEDVANTLEGIVLEHG